MGPAVNTASRVASVAAKRYGPVAVAAAKKYAPQAANRVKDVVRNVPIKKAGQVLNYMKMDNKGPRITPVKKAGEVVDYLKLKYKK